MVEVEVELIGLCIAESKIGCLETTRPTIVSGFRCQLQSCCRVGYVFVGWNDADFVEDLLKNETLPFFPAGSASVYVLGVR